MKNLALPIMVAMWIIGMFSVNVTLASQDYTNTLIVAIIAQVIMIGIYIVKFKSLGIAWRVIGGFFFATALWAIFNAITRLI